MKKISKKESAIKYLFLFLLASFLGRVYEFFLVLGQGSLNYWEYFPTSVYTLIFAFPYGAGILLIYPAIKFLDKFQFTKNNPILKLIICIALADIAELATGLIALNLFGIMPWDYSHHILNIKGLISLPTTIRWAILLVLLGKFAYPQTKDFMKKPLSNKIKNITLWTTIVYIIYLITFLLLKKF